MNWQIILSFQRYDSKIGIFSIALHEVIAVPTIAFALSLFPALRDNKKNVHWSRGGQQVMPQKFQAKSSKVVVHWSIEGFLANESYIFFVKN